MISKVKKIVGAVGLSAIMLMPAILATSPALAATTSDSIFDNLQRVASPSYGTTDENTLLENIANIIKVVLSLLGFIFVILMIYAGILWMTAAGNEKQVQKAKDIVSRAAIGLIIVVSAYAITYFIFANLPGGAGPA